MQAQAQHDRRRVGPTPQRGGAPETLRVWLLGGFRVSVGSRSLGEQQWRLRKAASLVKLLALAEGHWLCRLPVGIPPLAKLEVKGRKRSDHEGLPAGGAFSQALDASCRTPHEGEEQRMGVPGEKGSGGLRPENLEREEDAPALGLLRPLASPTLPPRRVQ